PWGTPEEEYIPAPLVYESEFALAKAQLKTQTPACAPQPFDSPMPAPTANRQLAPPLAPGILSEPPAVTNRGKESTDSTKGNKTNSTPGLTSPSADSATPPTNENRDSANAQATPTAYETGADGEELPQGDSTASNLPPPAESDFAAAGDTTAPIGARGPQGTLPPEWPDERGFIPPPPSPVRPPCCPCNGPIMTHTRIYQGNDSEFTEALASYYHFRDDARFGGWQNYLQRSDDFIRFCCHLDICEMLAARGGGGETRVVWQWPDCR
ncbi:MAG TPA: hypothetical protein VHE81_00765, partial [Lacipirellulaceae bacterium]|nr:hypothetical protein [Lacipirellulaceae bacterium]